MFQKKFLSTVLLMLAMAGFTPAVFSENNSEETVEGLEYLLFEDIPTVSLGFFKTDAKKAPGGYIYQINETKINTSTARSVHELLEQYTPGINVSYHFFGSLIGQRGIQIDANPKTLFMLEGHSLNTRHHFGYMTALDVPLIGDMQTLEVINGPGSMVYGTGAINGIINTLLKDGSTDAGFKVNTEYGFVDDLSKFEVDYAKKFSDTNNLYVYFGTLQAEGYKPNTNTKALSREGKTESEIQDIQEIEDLINGGGYKCKTYADDNYKFDINWHYGDFNLVTQFLNVNTISLSAQPNLYQETKILTGPNAGTTIPASERNMEYVWGQTHLLIMPKYNLNLSESNNLEFVTSLFMVDNANYNYDKNVFIENFPHNQTSEAEYYAKVTLKNTSIEKNSIAVGCSFSHRDFYHRDPIFRDQLDVSEGSSNIGYVGIAPEGKYFNWLESSVYAEDVIELTERTNFSAGLRYDAVKYGKDHVLGNVAGGGVGQIQIDDTYLSHVSPRAGLSFIQNETTSYKLSYQNAFRHPDLTNITAKAPDAPSTDIETMDSFEFNFNKKLLASLNFDFNLYYNILHDTIGWRIKHTGSNTAESEAEEGFTNTPESYASGGFEAIISYMMTQNSLIGASYSFTRPFDYSKELQTSAFGSVMEVDADREKWSRYPEHIVKLNFDQFFLEQKLIATISLAYTSAMQDRYDVEAQESMQSGRLQVDLMTGYTFLNGATMKFYAKNLTADENTRSPWSVQRSYGIVGWDERTYYLDIGLKI